MTIQATLAEVKEAHTALRDAIGELAAAVRDWGNYPTVAVQRDAVRRQLDAAADAFDEHERVLTAWAAGPNTKTTGSRS